ncbi:18S rRNA pseudouridine methyltransferase [Mortierella alpina]|nr:18S rRNA pseudouridine methyltransferase [Mortierella alpina]
MRIIKSILDGTANLPIIPTDHEATGHRGHQKLQALYSSCMNQTQIVKVGRRPLLEVIKKIVTLFPVKGSPFEHLQSPTTAETSEKSRDRNETSTIDPEAFSRTLAYFNRIGLDSIASFRVRRERVSEELTFELHSDAQGLYSELEYLTDRDDLDSGPERDAIANVAKTLHLLMTPEDVIGSDWLNAIGPQDVPQKWKRVAMDALGLASRLDKIHREPKIFALPREVLNMSKLVNWTLVLQRTLPPDVQQPIRITPVGSLVLDLDFYLEHKLLRSASSSAAAALQIQSYFVWRAVQQMVRYIDPHYGQFLRTAHETRLVRWKYCTEFVNSILGRMIGPYFVQQIRFDPTLAQVMIQTVQATLAEAFNNDLSSVSRSKRTREILRLGRALTLVGVDTGTVECLSTLDYLYRSYTVDSKDFFGNWIRFLVWSRANKFRGLKGFLTFEEGGLDVVLPQDVWIRHDLEGGEIQVPVGMLQPPFYHDDFPDYVNFARMGFRIAQEYARGLDFGEGPLATSMDMFCEDPKFCEKLRYNRDNYQRSAFDDPDVSGRWEGELAARSIGLQVAFDAWNNRSLSDRNNTSKFSQLCKGLQLHAWDNYEPRN